MTVALLSLPLFGRLLALKLKAMFILAGESSRLLSLPCWLASFTNCRRSGSPPVHSLIGTRLFLLSFGSHAEGVGGQRLCCSSWASSASSCKSLSSALLEEMRALFWPCCFSGQQPPSCPACLIGPAVRIKRCAQLVGVTDHVLGQGPPAGRLASGSR